MQRQKKLKSITHDQAKKILSELSAQERQNLSDVYDETHDDVLTSCSILASEGHPEYQDKQYIMDLAEQNASDAAWGSIGYQLTET